MIVPTLGGGAILAALNPGAFDPTLVLWAGIVASVELLPVPAWRGLQVSMGFPLLIVVGFLHPPIAAGATALVGSFDPREFRGEVGLLRALFNRCQVAVSVFAASSVFHLVASIETSTTWVLIVAAMLAAISDYLVNTALVTVGASIHYRMAPGRVIRELRIGRLNEFLISYLGLGVLALALAKIFLKTSFWPIPIFVAPLLLAR